MNKLTRDDKLQMGVCLGLSVFLSVVMYFFIIMTADSMILESERFAAAAFSAIYLLSMMPLVLKRGFDPLTFLFGAAVAACLIYVRVCLVYFMSGDFNSFLYNWVETLRPLSVGEALSQQLGDYNVPYMYILLIISRTGVDVLTAIKAVSCVFDVLLAFFVMQCVSVRTKDQRVLLAAYLLTLAIPTVFLNGAWWAQCDAVFCAFCVGSLWAALRRNGRWSVILWSLAFAFKLQAIFVLPAVIIAFVAKRIKLRYALWFPVVFVATLLPALFAGRGFMDCISIYFNQASQYPYLHMNAPTIWRLVGSVEFDNFNMLAIFLTGAAALLFMYLCITHRDGIGDRELVYIFYISALLLPYLLPRMHDRYFFVADVLSLLLFFYDRKKWYVPVFTVIASYATYVAYGMSDSGLFDQTKLSIALLVVLVLCLKELFESLRRCPATRAFDLSAFIGLGGAKDAADSEKSE